MREQGLLGAVHFLPRPGEGRRAAVPPPGVLQGRAPCTRLEGGGGRRGEAGGLGALTWSF